MAHIVNQSLAKTAELVRENTTARIEDGPVHWDDRSPGELLLAGWWSRAARGQSVDRYGYAAIAVLITLDDFGIPVPGETVLIAGAVHAGAGRLNIVLLVLITFVAAVVGDNIGYGIGRFGGRALLVRYVAGIARHLLHRHRRTDETTRR